MIGLRMSGKEPITGLEVEVPLSDGKTIRVTGLLAVRYRTDPDGVWALIEEELQKRDKNVHGVRS